MRIALAGGGIAPRVAPAGKHASGGAPGTHPPEAALRKTAEGVSLLRITPSQCLIRACGGT